MMKILVDKRLVAVEGWESIESRPGFRSPIDLAAREFKSPLAVYQLLEWVPCGISTCCTPHLRGYLVSMTDGLETNIGKDCGLKHLGLGFKEAIQQFDRLVEEQELREALHTSAGRLPEFRARIFEL